MLSLRKNLFSTKPN